MKKSSLLPTNRSTSCSTTPTFTVHPIVVPSSTFITKATTIAPTSVVPTTPKTVLPTLPINAAGRNDVRWGALGVAVFVVVLLA